MQINTGAMTQVQSVQPSTSRPASFSSPTNATLVNNEPVSAVVESVENGQVTLKLESGETLVAKQGSMNSLQVGDSLVMQVSGDASGHVSLKLMSVNSQSISTDMPSSYLPLVEMKLPATEQSLAALQALRSGGQTVSPETTARLSEILMRFPGLSPEQSALLASTPVPLSTENVAAFAEALQNPAASANFAEALMAFAAEHPSEAAPLLQAAAALLGESTASAQPASAQSAPAQGYAMPAGISTGTAAQLSADGAWQKISEQVAGKGSAAVNDIMGFVDQLPADTPMADRMAVFSRLTQIAREPAAQSDAPTAAQNAPQTPEAPRAAQSPQASQAPIQGAQTEQSANTQTLSRAIDTLFAKVDGENAENAAKQLQDAANGIGSKAQTLTRALMAAGGSSDILRSAVQLGQNLASQAQLMNDLGGLYHLQIPVKTDGKYRDASVYVTKRRGSKQAVDESNTTVAIGLDTENLGFLETLVKVEMDNLSIQFRVDDPEALKYVRSQLIRISSMEFPSRYRFAGASATLQTERINPENAARILNGAPQKAVAGGVDISV